VFQPCRVEEEHPTTAALELQPDKWDTGIGRRQAVGAVPHFDDENTTRVQVPAGTREDAPHHVESIGARGEPQAGSRRYSAGSSAISAALT